MCGYAPAPKKVQKKCIDTENRNLVSRAPGSKADEGFLPGRFFVCQDPGKHKNKRNTGRERTHTIHVSTQSTQNVSFMRTRSGSLAAVTARVPSHPANSGELRALPTSASGCSSRVTRSASGSDSSKQHRGWEKCSSEYHHRSIQFRIWV